MSIQNIFSWLNKFPFSWSLFAIIFYKVLDLNSVLFQQSASMRFAVSFDMLDPALCLCLEDIKTPLKAIKTLVTVSLELDAGTAQQY